MKLLDKSNCRECGEPHVIGYSYQFLGSPAVFENAQRAHSLLLAAGLASELK